jgi:hypothetical protein
MDSTGSEPVETAFGFSLSTQPSVALVACDIWIWITDA